MRLIVEVEDKLYVLTEYHGDHHGSCEICDLRADHSCGLEPIDCGKLEVATDIDSIYFKELKVSPETE